MVRDAGALSTRGVAAARGTAEGWLSFEDPVATLSARTLADVQPVLSEVERGLDRGFTAVGMVCYEAAPAFDDALLARTLEDLPYMWWGLYRRATPVPPAVFRALLDTELADLRTTRSTDSATAHFEGGSWSPLIKRADYDIAVEQVRSGIAQGDFYQVNLTFPMERSAAGERPVAVHGSGVGLLARLTAAQGPTLGALLDCRTNGAEWQVVSASPELFFRLDGDRISTRPMKGTAPRGRWPDEDLSRSRALLESEKDRAENLMIVDMMRNDLGRIARAGTVEVDGLWQVETYPTLHQLTSTITARTSASLSELFRALFPAASITGAPKVTAMRAIRELEGHPRGPYTGAIGFITPERRAQFNVAIRTAWRKTREGPFRYGVGGGIVWDSSATEEYRECQTKALVLTQEVPELQLLESLLWTAEGGYRFVADHLERLCQSARYFGYRYDQERVQLSLVGQARDLEGAWQRGDGPARAKVRLLLAADGAVAAESEPLLSERSRSSAGGRPLVRLAIDSSWVDSTSRWLFHKTTHRRVYEEALARARSLCANCDDVLLKNERGELTEATRANVLLLRDSKWFTPPISSGLLAGVFRKRLLEKRWLIEEVLTLADLRLAERVLLVNSVRGFMEVDRSLIASQIVGSEICEVD